MASAATLMMPTVDAAPTLALLDDEFFLAMESGRIQWGDLIGMDAAKITTELTKKDERVVEWWTDEYKTAERLEGWEVPDLTLRSDIEEHFPVVLQSLPASEDGRERFVVKFDDRVDEWAAMRAESQDENAEYADWVQTRLVFALRQYSHKYRLESEGGESRDHVAIFAMAHPSAAARRARAAIPTLLGFPVKWRRDRTDHTRHFIELDPKRMNETYDPAKLTEDMVDALTECKDCTFEAVESGSPYLMIVTIPSAEPPAAAPAPRPAPRPTPVHAAPAAAAPVPAPRPAMGGAGGYRHKPFIPILLSKKIQWKQDALDRSVHRIRLDVRTASGSRALSADEQNEIVHELRTCTDCRVELCPRDRMFFCIVTKLH